MTEIRGQRSEVSSQKPGSGLTLSPLPFARGLCTAVFLALCSMLLAPCFPAQAQQTGKIYRIGYLSPLNPARESSRAAIIRLALRDLGYIEGQNIAIEYRYAEGKRDRQPELAAELVRLKVDVIVAAGGEPLIRAAMNATTTIPIIMMGPGPDPVEAGLVKSFAHPGGNVTGLTYLSTELGGKRLEILKEAVAKMTRVAVLYDPATPGTTREVKEDLPVAARALGLVVQPWQVRDADGLEKFFAALSKERPHGLYVPLTGALMRASGKRIAGFALKNRIPSLFGDKAVVIAGGLMYYGADLGDTYRRVAIYVDKILKGTKPADLPVQQPMKFEFIVNLKAAKQIGLTIPPNVLVRADRVIK
ncbi:MAG TPA: ABC transporter substrate-binding protein [Candidatus Binatia bacterium]|nr:ABC transporter substrate-binding protein [Candidatus Binatia bacterium]